MENRKLVGNIVRLFKAAVTIALVSTLTGTLVLTPIMADNHGKIRMYKLNSKNQQIKQGWVKDVNQPGCHNTLKSREVYRFAQLGYEFCQLFSEKDCANGNEVAAMWGEEKYRLADFDVSKPQTSLIRGTQWILDPEVNITIRSWSCQYN